ncbi:putative phage abortive infection protein [Salimicrobium jeotgali]|uniref:putative phage abortive infection protein n=1 Tax=Salimicrobium jeotgali TaxID=1230341 RepID=UPI000C84010B|nr:putative phage abortive infection protein [Salimicrobium jeotgali]
MNSKENIKTNSSWFWAGFVTVLLALATPFVIMGLASKAFNVNDLTSLGGLGDFFGGSTIGLLSIASIFFIIHTITIQSKELSLQREELSLTREEMERTRKEYEVTNETMKLQKFETTFFNMMLLLENIVSDISIQTRGGKNIEGRKAFVTFYDYFAFMTGTGSSSAKENLRVYLEFYKEYRADLGHYFSHLESILKFIDNSNIENKGIYIDILKSQLSTYEIVHLFYFGNSEFAGEFGNLSREYGLLKNLDTSLLIENL